MQMVMACRCAKRLLLLFCFLQRKPQPLVTPPCSVYDSSGHPCVHAAGCKRHDAASRHPVAVNWQLSGPACSLCCCLQRADLLLPRLASHVAACAVETLHGGALPCSDLAT